MVAGQISEGSRKSTASTLVPTSNGVIRLVYNYKKKINNINNEVI